MPSQYSRLGVVRDPRVDAALRRASRVLGEQPAATLARELILRGAETLDSDREELRSWLEERGVKLATRSFRDPLPPLPPFDPNDPTPGTDALQEQREDIV